jgi:hypothetical protein
MAPKKLEEKKAPAAPGSKKLVPGKALYQLSQDIYREGRYLRRGEFISVTDEVKWDSWRPVKKVPPKGKLTELVKPKKKVKLEADFDGPNTDLGADVEGFEDEAGTEERASDSDA